MGIRQAVPADLSQVYAIEKRAGFSQWSENQIRLAIESFQVWLVEKESHIVGFAIFNIVMPEAELLDIVIWPDCQGQGHGWYLLESCLENLLHSGVETCFLEVADNNLSARSLYEKQGFDYEGLRKNYYRRGDVMDDAHIMKKQLV